MFEPLIRSLPYLPRVFLYLTVCIVVIVCVFGCAFGFDRVGTWIGNLIDRPTPTPPVPPPQTPPDESGFLAQRLAEAERKVGRMEADARHATDRAERAGRIVSAKSVEMDASAGRQQHAKGAVAQRLHADFVALAGEHDAAVAEIAEAKADGKQLATELARLRPLLARARAAVGARATDARVAVDELSNALDR